jgi:hypothetical protein
MGPGKAEFAEADRAIVIDVDLDAIADIRPKAIEHAGHEAQGSLRSGGEA